MRFVIEKAVDRKTKEDTERYGTRLGSYVHIEGISLGSPLFVTYEDGSGALRTSVVEAYNSEWQQSSALHVQTANTVYTFRKVSE